jgi:ATP phosphoribosyltransferase regulatory subunit
MHYYSGIVFGGFIDGIPESVLSGGQYGRLMEKMGRRADAVGFAIYLDLLSFLDGTREAFDVDVLVIADKGTPASAILELTDALTKDGKSVSVQSAIPEKLRYRELLRV